MKNLNEFRQTLLAFVLLLFGGILMAQPTISVQFSPNMIAPGSASLMTFTITNGSATPATDLAFTNTLATSPGNIVIATPGAVFNSCDGTVTAADGSGSISLVNGRLPGLSSCMITVQVTGTTAGAHTNAAVTLASSAGNSMSVSTDLTIATNRPIFTKSFSPAIVDVGEKSRLTFTIDNGLNGSNSFNGSFTDALPAGMVVSSPANLVSDCTASVTANEGASSLSLFSLFLASGSSCTVEVDVETSTIGESVNSATFSSTSGSSGIATAALTAERSSLFISKSFTNDPVSPGGMVDVTYTINFSDRNNDATDVAFTDDLDAVLSGLVATGLPMNNVCGTGSMLSGTSVLSLTGGTIPSNGGSCTFTVTLQVPAGASSDTYPSKSSQVTAMAGGSNVTGNDADDALIVAPTPTITKSFVTNPVGAGMTTTIRFRIDNSTVEDLTGLAFTDDLTAFLGGLSPTMVNPSVPNPPCGAGSSITGTTILSFTGGNLTAGSHCEFDVQITLPTGLSAGSYTNTTSNLTGTAGATPVTGLPASAGLTVFAAPNFSKSFTNDPVNPGGTVDLEFTLTNSANNPTDATMIAFTDDLTSMGLAGLTATGLPMNNICGTGSSITGTTSLSFSGGTLAPGSNCSFTVTLQVPAGAAPTTYNNTTSVVTASINGSTITGGTAFAALEVNPLTFTKEYIDDPVIAGDLATLRFTIALDANSPTDATMIAFDDNLITGLTGADVEGTLPPNPCGSGSSITEPIAGLLRFTNGSLTPGTSCSFDVQVRVPAGTADGDYVNQTTFLTAMVDGNGVGTNPARDVLEVNSSILQVTKSFTDSPVEQGGTSNLEFTITNLDANNAVSNIALMDDLDAVLSGLVATGLPATACGGTLSGTSTLSLTGGSLAAGGSCTFSVTLNVPTGSVGTFTNTADAPTGMVGALPVTGNQATADLRIIEDVDLTMTIDNPNCAGATTTIQYTLENLDPTNTVTAINFTQDLNSVISGMVATGLPQANPCNGAGSLSGTGTINFTGGELAAGASCNFTVTVQLPANAATGTFALPTSDLSASGGSGAITSAGATANLVVIEPVEISIDYPDLAAPGETTTLNVTLTNPNASTAFSGIGFTNDLNALIAGLAATGLPQSNVCGAGSMLSGGGVVTLAGASLAAGGSCSFSITVQVPNSATGGTFTNTTSNVTGTSGTKSFSVAGASADLVVAEPLSIAMSYADEVVIGGTTTLNFTLTNPNSHAPFTGVSFTNNLNAVLAGLTATDLPKTNICGTGSSLTGTSSVSFTGGTIPASGNCSFSVTVQVPNSATSGTYPNTTSDVSGTISSKAFTNTGAMANLVVIDPLEITMAYAGVADIGGTTTLDITLTNPNTSTAYTAVSFTNDLNALIAGMTATDLPKNNICGTGSSLTGTGTISFTGGTVPAGGTCNFSITVQVPNTASAGVYPNTTSNVAATYDTQLLSFAGAMANLTVRSPLQIVMSYDGGGAEPGGIATLRFMLTNPDPGTAVSDINFTNDLEALLAGLMVTSAPQSDICGAGSSVSGTSVLSFTGGSLAASGTCSFTVQVMVPTIAPIVKMTNTTSPINFMKSGMSGTLPGVSASFTAITLVPTLSEWGLIIIAIMMMIIGTVKAYQRQFVLQSINRKTIPFVNQVLFFNRTLFQQCLLGTIVLALLLGCLSIGLTGTITGVDILGSIVIIPLLAYLGHLLIMMEKKKQ